MFQNTFKLLAAVNPQDIIGAPITPPISGLTDPIAGLSRLLVVGLQIFFTVCAIAVLIYLLWGAFDWITSGGEAEKIAQAQSKMTNAVIGILIMVAALSIFIVVTGDMLGVVKRDASGNWLFRIPSINDQPPVTACIQQNQQCNITNNNNCCSGLSCVPSGGSPSGSGTCR